MEVVAHADVAEFARLVRPLLDRDPVRHTTVLSTLSGLARSGGTAAAMLTARESDVIVGALLRNEGWGSLVSAVPPRCAPVMVDALLRLGIDGGGAMGPVDEAQAFASAWAAETGASIEVGMRMRLFALDELAPPTGVPGAARPVGPDDDARITLLAAWHRAFERELHPAAPNPSARPDGIARALGSGAGELLWEVGGAPVALAAARAVTAGMSRIGPVYTPPEHRCHGYAAAVTAAAAQWARDRGARHVLLYTDLDNPTTNRLYPRLGFRPRYDAVELRFGTTSPAHARSAG